MWANGGAGNHIPVAVKRTVWARQRGKCATYDPTVCTGQLDEYDHRVNAKASGKPRHTATAEEVQGLCRACHKAKTQAEAQAGKRSKRYRDPPPHPGLVQ